MQVTIARQLGLEPTTVGNFFMNARRRSMDKWKEESETTKSQSSAGSNGNGGGSQIGNSGGGVTAAVPAGQQLSHQGQTVHVVTVHHPGLSSNQQVQNDLHSSEPVWHATPAH